MSERRGEVRGIEWVPRHERHGKPEQLFTLWFAANLGMPAFLVGVLGPVLGLNLLQSGLAVVLGNILAATLVAFTAAAGSGQGLPQLMLVRSVFGRRGNYVPSALNTLSAIGWYTINTAVGGEAVAALLHWPIAVGLALLALAQIALGYFGYDVIHRFEHIMVYVQGLLFAAMSVAAVFDFSKMTLGHPAHYGDFLLELAAVVSYSFSWSPYASDYGRYLPEKTPARRVFWATFGGTFVSTFWVEALGTIVGLLGWGALSPVGMVQHLMGGAASMALLAIVFGAMTANAVNVYTATLSLLALDVKIRRMLAVVLLGAMGWLAAWMANSHLLSDYDNFLLLLSYWVAPWLGVVLVAAHRGWVTHTNALSGFLWRWPALWSFMLGVLAVIPFMSTTLFEGPVAHWLDNGDTGYYVGFAVAAAAYHFWPRKHASAEQKHAAQ